MSLDGILKMNTDSMDWPMLYTGNPMHDSFRPLMFDCTKSEICLQKVLFIGS